jgi:hypothetical protein
MVAVWLVVFSKLIYFSPIIKRVSIIYQRVSLMIFL